MASPAMSRIAFAIVLLELGFILSPSSRAYSLSCVNPLTRSLARLPPLLKNLAMAPFVAIPSISLRILLIRSEKAFQLSEFISSSGAISACILSSTSVVTSSRSNGLGISSRSSSFKIPRIDISIRLV